MQNVISSPRKKKIITGVTKFKTASWWTNLKLVMKRRMTKMENDVSDPTGRGLFGISS